MSVSRQIAAVLLVLFVVAPMCRAAGVKQPDVAGQFYPADPAALSAMIDGFLAQAKPGQVDGDISALIVPHAGYEFSAQTAAYAYKLVPGKAFTTVVLMASSHRSVFNGIAVAGQGAFRTPLGDIPVDRGFVSQLAAGAGGAFIADDVFGDEHPIEVHLPFIRRILPGAQVVPVIFGQVDYAALERFSAVLARAIGSRKDVLLIASSDMYHGYDPRQAEAVDRLTLDHLRAMDVQGLYRALEEKKAQLCGGPAVVTAMLVAQKTGPAKLTVLAHTNSAKVRGHVLTDVSPYTVGYSSSVITVENAAGRLQGEGTMLTQVQRRRLLEIARNSIETYLKTGKKLKVEESDAVLAQKMGAFVTLHERGELRGCIGNIVGTQALYLTVRDMAVEAAVGDPRFDPLKLSELKDVTIEISALSVLEKASSADEIELGKHGVIVKRGFKSGVFLPQVATETGWSKEEFLSTLCSQKAGLPPDAWKDPATELYIFTAEVFSE